MLVLSRQKEQTIMIGDLIEITIVDIRGDKVRLGISAPVTVPVHRKEVYEAIQSENRAAAKVAVSDVSLLETIMRRPAGTDTPGGAHAPATVTGPIPNTAAPKSSGA